MIMLGWFTLIVVCTALLLATVRDVRRQLRTPTGQAEPFAGVENDVPSIVPSGIQKETK